MATMYQDRFYANSKKEDDFEEIEKKWVLAENPRKEQSELTFRRQNRHSRESRMSGSLLMALDKTNSIEQDQLMTDRSEKNPKRKLDISREKRKNSPISSYRTGELLDRTDSKIKDLEATWDSIKRTRSYSVAPDIEKSPEFKREESKRETQEETKEPEIEETQSENQREEEQEIHLSNQKQLKNHRNELGYHSTLLESKELPFFESNTPSLFESIRPSGFETQGAANLQVGVPRGMGETDPIFSPSYVITDNRRVVVESGFLKKEPKTPEELYLVDSIQPKVSSRGESLYKLDILKKKLKMKKNADEKEEIERKAKESPRKQEKTASISPIRIYKDRISRIKPTSQYGKPRIPNPKESPSASSASQQKRTILEQKQHQVWVFREMIDRIQKDIDIEKKSLEKLENGVPEKKKRPKTALLASCKKLDVPKRETGYLEMYNQQHQLATTPSWAQEKGEQLEQAQRVKSAKERTGRTIQKPKKNEISAQNIQGPRRKIKDSRSVNPLEERKDKGENENQKNSQKPESQREKVKESEVLNEVASNYGELLKNYQRMKGKKPGNDDQIQEKRNVSKSPLVIKRTNRDKGGPNKPSQPRTGTKTNQNPMKTSKSPERPLTENMKNQKDIFKSSQKAWLMNK